MKDNDGLKILLWTVGGFLCVAAIACAWEKFHPSNKYWTGEYATCEIHADRPLDQVIFEAIHENETRAEREVRESEERTQDTDFGRMS
jgi:hypothetical protein